MTTHRLKTWPKQFGAVVSGVKRFDVRKDDRGFAVGDAVVLDEWDPDEEKYTGAMAYFHVVYKLDGGQFGIEPGYCVLGLSEAP